MALLYKLTNAKGFTYNNTLWGPGVSHSGTGEGPLCSEGWIHAYTHPLLAALLYPLHVDFEGLMLWEAEGEIGLNDRGLKVGCKTLTTLREIPVPVLTAQQLVYFSILCAKKVHSNEKWNAWADKWLSGEDRSRKSAVFLYSSMNTSDDGNVVAWQAVRSAAAAVLKTIQYDYYTVVLNAARIVNDVVNRTSCVADLKLLQQINFDPIVLAEQVFSMDLDGKSSKKKVKN